MGIVDTTITTHSSVRVCTDGGTSSKYESSKSFDKTIYRILSMQSDMKTIEYPGRVMNEFDSFIEQATLKTNGLGYNTAFDSLDEYLGTIGVTDGIC